MNISNRLVELGKKVALRAQGGYVSTFQFVLPFVANSVLQIKIVCVSAASASMDLMYSFQSP